jgi:hypothetical protein
MNKTWLLPIVASEGAAPEAGLVGHPCYTTSNERIMVEKQVGKDVEGSGRCIISRFYPGIFLEDLGEDTKNLIQASRSLGRDMNPEPPEYEAGVLTTTFGDGLLFSIYTIEDRELMWWFSLRKYFFIILRVILRYM